MSRLTLPEFTPETASKDFRYTFIDESEPVKAGEGMPRRIYSLKGGTMVKDVPGVENVLDNLEQSVKKHGKRNMYGHRAISKGIPGPYIWETYEQIYERVKNVGSALIERGYKPNENIGLFSINRKEWVIGEYGSAWAGLVNVPLYDTLGDEAIEYIINKVEMKLVFATSDKAKILIKIASKVPTLGVIVVMDGIDQSLEQEAKKTKLKLVSFGDLEVEGINHPKEKFHAKKDDVFTISFTSGTTGVPKGAMITHANFIGFIAGLRSFFENGHMINLTCEEVHISYLPLAHILERIFQVAFINFGASMGFYQGDTLKLLDDVQELKPTVFLSVPRLYNRIYDKVLGGVKTAGGIKAYLFNYAYQAKKHWLARGWINHSIWDALVFGTVREKLGGRVRMMVTGAAPISPDVLDFLRICFSATVCEGYGSTECTGSGCATHKQDLEPGHVGTPFPHMMVKLRDVPSMNYYSTDMPFPRGEICFKGAGVFKGYYKEPEKTRETLSEDGWLYTGDVGYWDDKGRLHVIDRVKNIFKLAQGEYIAPEKIEAVFVKHEIVAQAFVYGDSLQSSLVAIIVVDQEFFGQWAKEKGFNGTVKELVAKKEVIKAVVNSLDTLGRENGLKGFENVKAIHLELDPFTVENGLMTPTFKLKRHDAKLKYKKEINDLYSSINTPV